MRFGTLHGPSISLKQSANRSRALDRERGFSQPQTRLKFNWVAFKVVDAALFPKIYSGGCRAGVRLAFVLDANIFVKVTHFESRYGYVEAIVMVQAFARLNHRP